MKNIPTPGLIAALWSELDVLALLAIVDEAFSHSADLKG